VALGQITEAELEDGLGGHATDVWTDEFDFAGTSQWHMDIAHAPGWGTKVLEHSHGRDRAVLVACLPAASRRSFDAPDDAAP
jgi:hypothetical protein